MKKEYFKIESLKDLYLEDSYVLDISLRDNNADIVVEAVLTDNSPLYRKPAKGDQYCYQKGIIRFHDINGYKWIYENMKPIVDIDNEVDYGNIDFLYFENGKYRVGGEWGELEIVTDKEPEFVLDNKNL